MASGASANESGMEILKIPRIDLRSFCQDELHLAAQFLGASKSGFPDLVIPTLDKALFNPSIGSRKQTYCRRSRGRPRAEQNFSSSLTVQSRVTIQQSIAKQFKALTAETLARASRKQLDMEICQDGPHNWPIIDFHHSDQHPMYKEDSGIAPPESLSLWRVDSEMCSEKELSDTGLSGQKNIQLFVSSDSKRVEAPCEGKDIALQQESERASQALGQESESAIDVSATRRPLKRMKIKEGARKRLVSEILARESLRESMDSKKNDSLKEFPPFANGGTEEKGLELPNLPSVSLHENSIQEEATFGSDFMDVKALSRDETKTLNIASAHPIVGGEKCDKGSEIQESVTTMEPQKDSNESSEVVRKMHEDESVFLECLSKMEGKWLSNEMAQKIVDAKGFPKGWKVTIGLNKKKGRIFFEYHDYQSPDGKLWSSFKEASQYLVSELKKVSIFSTISSIALVNANQQPQTDLNVDGSEALAQTVSTSSDDMVLKSLQPRIMKQLPNKKGVFRKGKQGITEAEASSEFFFKEDTEADSAIKGELKTESELKAKLVQMNEEDSSIPIALKSTPLVETLQLIGWNKEGCCLCKMIVDWDKLCVCSWCENEFHVGCLEAACGRVNGYDSLCPTCKSE